MRGAPAQPLATFEARLGHRALSIWRRRLNAPRRGRRLRLRRDRKPERLTAKHHRQAQFAAEDLDEMRRLGDIGAAPRRNAISSRRHAVAGMVVSVSAAPTM
jgi:hypothetical protein